MAMIGKVLRMHYRENKSVREIAKAADLSRNTVRKYLCTLVAQPRKCPRKAASTKKLLPYAETVKMAVYWRMRVARRGAANGQGTAQADCGGEAMGAVTPS